MILSTRERAEIRRDLFEVGISQISAGSRTAPGGYKESQESLDDHELEQFQLGDHRSLEEVVKDITSLGYMPSFCTACSFFIFGTPGLICGRGALAVFTGFSSTFCSCCIFF